MTEHEIFQSVIKTTERMTYSDVNRILTEDDAELKERYEPLVPMFKDMERLAEILRAKRMTEAPWILISKRRRCSSMRKAPLKTSSSESAQ